MLVFSITVAFTGSVQSGSLYELETSLTDRAKLKSLGVKDWVGFDPNEIVLGQPRPDEKTWIFTGQGTALQQLLTLIAFAEAGSKQYDAVHFGAKRKTPKRPTQMTIREVQRWVRATPKQPHAIGRYQFIPSTFNTLVRKLGLPGDTKFNAQTQDKLAYQLLVGAGYTKFQKGQISQSNFMDRLAKVWAGLPTRNGKSYYDKYAGNRATISRSFFKREMQRIFGKS